jgi:chemotaxis protein histidine kinase CheA
MSRVWSAVLASTAIGLLSVPASAQFKKGGGAPAPAAAPHFSAPAAAPHFSAPAAMPHFSAPTPHFSAPQVHVAPHVAAPVIRSVPHFSTPHTEPHITVREAPHIAHTETLRTVKTPNTGASSAKLQALSRAELHTQQRLDRLEQRAQTGHLTGSEQKQLSTLHEQQAHQQQLHEQNALKLQDEQKLREQNAHKLEDEKKLHEQSVQKLQEENKLKDAQRLQEQQKLREQNAQKLQEEKKQREAEDLRRKEKPRVTAQEAAQGRFAKNLRHEAAETPAEEAREAWRHRRAAFFVPWIGPVFWPYVYSDIFYYTFWPYGYDDFYWPYVYDDFFETVFWPNGGPYADPYYSGPYGGDFTAALPDPRPGVRLSARSRANTQQTQLARALCSDPGNGVTAWPFGQIERAVLPTSDQQALLDNLKRAAATAASDFKASCSSDFPMTPPGRLRAMLSRLQATREAIAAVRVPLATFYDSLSDEQKARFNAIGPNLAQAEARAAGTRGTQGDPSNSCSGAKPGLIDLPIERIADAVRPFGEQQAALDRLKDATAQAVADLQAACPDTAPVTPVGRLDAMASRLDALIAAAKTVEPALESFYGSLSDEQKAQFNVLGRRQTAGG